MYTKYIQSQQSKYGRCVFKFSGQTLFLFKEGNHQCPLIRLFCKITFNVVLPVALPARIGDAREGSQYIPKIQMEFYGKDIILSIL